MTKKNGMYIKEDKSGMLTVVNKLSYEDYDCGKVQKTSHGDVASAHVIITFNHPEDLTEKEKELFDFTPYQASHVTDEDYKKYRYRKNISKSECVKMQGVRKDKQPLKLKKVTDELVKQNLRGHKLRMSLAANIEEKNKDIASKIVRHNKNVIRDKVGVYSNTSNWQWDGDVKKDIDELDEQIQGARSLMQSLVKRKHRIQKNEIVKSVKESKDVHEDVKEAFIEHVEKNGIQTNHFGILY